MRKLFSVIMCIGILIASMTSAFAEEKQELLVTTLDYFTEEDIKNTADRLFSKIDDNSDTAEIVKAYKAGSYLEALGLFRNYMIDRFRATPQEECAVSAFAWDYKYAVADIAVGYMAPEEINTQYAHRTDLKKINAADVEHVLDYIDSSQPSHLVWAGRDEIAGDERLIIHDDYQHGFTMLACRYAATGDPIYLKKALQLMEDFADNFPKQVDEFYGITDLSFDERGYMAKTLPNTVYMYNKEGSRASNYNVNKGQRSNCFWWALNILAKGLPGEYEHKDRHNRYYNTLLTTVIKEKPSPEGYNLIDPVRFAKFITLILEKEYPAMTKSVLDKPGGAQNIELEVKRNAVRYAAILKDFSGAVEFLPELIESLNARMGNSAYIDGGAIETSFNYNKLDIGSRKTFTETINALAPDFVTEYGLMDFSKQAVMYERMEELYTSPLGLLSRIGNSNAVFGTPPVWKNEEKLTALKETLGDKEQAYTSAYLPYSGYGSMRSGWDVDDLYLAFYNNDRFTTGHGFMGRNAVMNLTAYGRTLLMCGGVPYYGLSYVSQYPEFIENGYDEINGYFSEDSTRKNSTVMVNDKSQNRKDFMFDENGDYDASKNTGSAKFGTVISESDNRILRSRWLTDEHYDFAEGTYDGGYTHLYGIMGTTALNPSKVGDTSRDARHDRSFVYVKDADLFIVTDTMTNTYKLSNKYRALWHFPAYLEGVENLSGFKDEQVVLDEEKNMFYTDDPEGPNLYVYNFSNNDLSYEKYCGYFKKGELAWGWGDGGNNPLTGKFTPRPEVHVLWNDAKRGDVTKVSAVLAPSKNNTNPIASVKDNSTDKLHSFEVVKTDGTKVKVFNSEEKIRLEFDGIEVCAKDLIITQGADGKYKSAVALDCDYFISNNVTPIYMISKNCSVEFKDNGLIGKVTQFDVPTGFKWIDTDDGKHIPSYK